MTIKTNKPMAEFFYEQCAGTFSGHMAHVANNPVLFGVVKAHSETEGDVYAATKAEFAELLRSIADELVD